jgi:hypothetical protein
MTFQITCFRNTDVKHGAAPNPSFTCSNKKTHGFAVHKLQALMRSIVRSHLFTSLHIVYKVSNNFDIHKRKATDKIPPFSRNLIRHPGVGSPELGQPPHPFILRPAISFFSSLHILSYVLSSMPGRGWD